MNVQAPKKQPTKFAHKVSSFPEATDLPFMAVVALISRR